MSDGSKGSTCHGRIGSSENRLAQKQDLPRSVLGPARSCLNLSSREASLSLSAELLRVPGSDVLPRATVAVCGSDWDLCRGAGPLALSAGEREEGEGRGGRPRATPRERWGQCLLPQH